MGFGRSFTGGMVKMVKMSGIKPLYINGKRDKARRYVLPSGDIISRRQYIKITEGVSPEEKAIQRVKAGKAKPGKTYKRYLERKAKKEKKAKVQLPKRKEYPRIPQKVMPTGGKWGEYQLQGKYRFYNMKYRYYAESIGYSTVTGTKYKYGSPNYIILRRQAIENAVAKLDGYEWVYEGVIEEVWLLW